MSEEPFPIDCAIDDFIAARDKLNKLVREKFPWGTVVRLKRDGDYGVVVSGGNSPGMVPVLRENDNIWDTVATGLDVVEDKKKWPPWLIRKKRRMVPPQYL